MTEAEVEVLRCIPDPHVARRIINAARALELSELRDAASRLLPRDAPPIPARVWRNECFVAQSCVGDASLTIYGDGAFDVRDGLWELEYWPPSDCIHVARHCAHGEAYSGTFWRTGGRVVVEFVAKSMKATAVRGTCTFDVRGNWTPDMINAMWFRTLGFDIVDINDPYLPLWERPLKTLPVAELLGTASGLLAGALAAL